MSNSSTQKNTSRSGGARGKRRSSNPAFKKVNHATRIRMQAIRRRDTTPELLVRGLVRQIGVRFRSQRVDLPGRPDFVFAAPRKIIFVHGCFWHGHRGCRRARLPTKNALAWLTKVALNQARDKRVVNDLVRHGWKILIVWECETSDASQLKEKLARFLS